MKISTKIHSFFIRFKKQLLATGGTFFVFLIWWIISLVVTRVIIPSPIDTIIRLGEMFTESATYQNILGTIYRLFIGFIIAFFFGSLLGLVAGMHENVATFFKPLITTLRTLPTAAVILVFITLVSSLHAPYYIVFLAVFPIAYESTLQGVLSVSTRYAHVLRIEGAKRVNSVIRVIIPLSMPYIVLGLISSLGLAMKIEIMSEIISGNTKLNGVGVALRTSMSLLEMKDVFAYSIIVIAFIGGIEYLLNRIKKNIG